MNTSEWWCSQKVFDILLDFELTKFNNNINEYCRGTAIKILIIYIAFKLMYFVGFVLWHF